MATGISALKKGSEADDCAAAGDQARLDEVRPTARRLAITTDALIGVGAAMLVAGVVCHVVLPRRVERQVTLAPWRVAVRF